MARCTTALYANVHKFCNPHACAQAAFTLGTTTVFTCSVNDTQKNNVTKNGVVEIINGVWVSSSHACCLRPHLAQRAVLLGLYVQGTRISKGRFPTLLHKEWTKPVTRLETGPKPAVQAICAGYTAHHTWLNTTKPTHQTMHHHTSGMV
jgi:hypothetical protein